MHSKFALLQNTMDFIHDRMRDKGMCRSKGDDILYRLVFNLKNMMDSNGCIIKTRMMETGIVLERYIARFSDGILVYSEGCKEPRDEGHLFDRDSIAFLCNMMEVK